MLGLQSINKVKELSVMKPKNRKYNTSCCNLEETAEFYRSIKEFLFNLLTRQVGEKQIWEQDMEMWMSVKVEEQGPDCLGFDPNLVLTSWMTLGKLFAFLPMTPHL